MENFVALAAKIRQVSDVRYTPAGLPVLEMLLEHASEQHEMGKNRIVKCEINAKLLGQMALAWKDTVDNMVKVEGFLACRSFKDSRLVLHIQNIEHLKG